MINNLKHQLRNKSSMRLHLLLKLVRNASDGVTSSTACCLRLQLPHYEARLQYQLIPHKPLKFQLWSHKVHRQCPWILQSNLTTTTQIFRIFDSHLSFIKSIKLCLLVIICWKHSFHYCLEYYLEEDYRSRYFIKNLPHKSKCCWNNGKESSLGFSRLWETSIK